MAIWNFIENELSLVGEINELKMFIFSKNLFSLKMADLKCRDESKPLLTYVLIILVHSGMKNCIIRKKFFFSIFKFF